MTHSGKQSPNLNGTARLEAFSDAVFGILITIMVLGIEPPAGATLSDLKPLIPKLLVYALSFAFLGIYWNNHHHLLRATEHISGWLMWAKLHLLFWLSLIPIVTAWVGKHPLDAWPVAFYGIVATLAATAYSPVLTTAIARANPESTATRLLRRNWKENLSIVLYLLAVAAAFIAPVFSFTLYATVSLSWFIPDKRLEKLPSGDHQE